MFDNYISSIINNSSYKPKFAIKLDSVNSKQISINTNNDIKDYNLKFDSLKTNSKKKEIRFENTPKTKSKLIKKYSCKCSKIGCNQKYCLCYANGQICNEDCRCIQCENKNTEKLTKSTQKNKLLLCKCTKTGCLKKYCECYNKGQACNPKCKCKDCKNIGINQSLGNISYSINQYTKSNKILDYSSVSNLCNSFNNFDMLQKKRNKTQKQELKIKPLVINKNIKNMFKNIQDKSSTDNTSVL